MIRRVNAFHVICKHQTKMFGRLSKNSVSGLSIGDPGHGHHLGLVKETLIPMDRDKARKDAGCYFVAFSVPRILPRYYNSVCT